ncbi:MAG: 1,4-alpha-glucan branching protein GlgB [Proteobacteria bacterium]|nr:1,4-alpha-glucan branching protein GlgB [Pseudomonadota bacterium]
MRSWTQDDLDRFHRGQHFDLHTLLGAHWTGQAVVFRVWAPGASRVSVVGDFNGWETDASPMVKLEGSEIWRVRVSGVPVGACYKFRIQSARDGSWVEKADPMAIQSEVPPRSASKVAARGHRWKDVGWMKRRDAEDPWTQALSVYEVHLGSWGRQVQAEDQPLYRAIAEPLADYAVEMGFTHVELMPVMEHPYYPSWGYQVTGYFAPTSRYGSPEDFKALVETLHRRGIGVILDWVPAHFPSDGHGLFKFNGDAIYEHPDPRRGWHPDWSTAIFDYGRPEVRSFLLSSAWYWIEQFHADGLRVDAVASMLYLDYSRDDGEWLPNARGGRENDDAVSLFQLLNQEVGRRSPRVLMMAEDSTAWPGVSRPVESGGLGFGFKWDMGWMNDTLRYFSKDPVHRKFHHNDLTFRAVYAQSENFVLPLSHDEVVHGKGSLLGKMPGDRWQQFANLRLLFGSMFAQPGKKLLFMGSELATDEEWNCDKALPWDVLDQAENRGVQKLVADLNRLYVDAPALHAGDHSSEGFEWIDGGDSEQSVVSFLRRDPGSAKTMLVVCNYTPTPRPQYRVGVPTSGAWHVALNTDAAEYTGSGFGSMADLTADEVPCHGREASLCLDLPPLGALFIEVA